MLGWTVHEHGNYNICIYGYQDVLGAWSATEGHSAGNIAN